MMFSIYFSEKVSEKLSQILTKFVGQCFGVFLQCFARKDDSAIATVGEEFPHHDVEADITGAADLQNN